jgi:hypothetical protein
MRFPESSREGDAAHTSAVRRLDQALDDCRRLVEEHDAVRETPAEVAALDRLDAGRAQVSARETWLTWVERGF